MYKTLTISSVVMILAFSGYVSEVPSSKVSISIEIDFPEENIDKKTLRMYIQDVTLKQE